MFCLQSWEILLCLYIPICLKKTQKKKKSDPTLPACTKYLAAYCIDTKRNNLRSAHWSGSKLDDRHVIFVIFSGPLGLVSGPLLIHDTFSLIDQLLGHRKQWIINEAENLICHLKKKNIQELLPRYQVVFFTSGMPVHVNKIPPFNGTTFNQRCAVLKQRAPLAQKGGKNKPKNRNWKEKIPGRESG